MNAPAPLPEDLTAPVGSLDELLALEGAAFVECAYRTLLCRWPDPEGRAYYQGRLEAGDAKMNVVRDMRHSGEGRRLAVQVKGLEDGLWQHRFRHLAPARTAGDVLALDGEDFVYQAYRTVLGRAPDEAGFAEYLRLLQHGEAKVRLLAGMLNSPEAQARGAQLPGMGWQAFRHRLERIGKPPVVIPEAPPAAPEAAPVEAPAEAVAAPPPPAPSPTPAPRPPREKPPRRPGQRIFWHDVTTVMEWTGGVVGIIRAELEIAAGLQKLDPEVRFCMQRGNGFIEVPKPSLQWLFEAENVADAYMQRFERYPQEKYGGQPNSTQAADQLGLDKGESDALFHPFENGDSVVSAGWMDSQKEKYYARVKAQMPGFYLAYLCFDIIMLLPETRHFYPEEGRVRFQGYVKWMSQHCDLMLFGGETAKRDTQRLQEEMGWPVPPGAAVKFGTDIVKSVDETRERALLREMGIHGPFVIAVGSIEPRKNHDTLYRMYLLAMEMHEGRGELPQLVICGRPMWRCEDLVDTLDRDPRLAGRFLHLSPTDMQLAALYKHCDFTILASLYEGWSLPLPESLGQGKFCLTTDTPPLREIGRDLVDYAPGWDVRQWAEKFIHYATHPQDVAARNRRIAAEWPNTTWKDTAGMFLAAIRSHAAAHPPKPRMPTIWFDLTVSYVYWTGSLSGIVRSELSYAKYLADLAPDVRFFGNYGESLFEIRRDYLLWLFENDDLSAAYSSFQQFWARHEADKTGHRVSIHEAYAAGTAGSHPDHLASFPDDAIVVFTSIDMNELGEPKRVKLVRALADRARNVTCAQLVYDLTPFLLPQFHRESSVRGYQAFYEYVSQHFDHLVYGGATALRDGKALQAARGWKTPTSDWIKLGSSLAEHAGAAAWRPHDEQVLDRHGIRGNYALCVGTIEPRKNHEMLYKAYVTMMNRMGTEHPPQLVLVGQAGWKTGDFLANLKADARVKGHILLLTPSDEDLRVLYRNCLFTVLPTFYEGWSLTLPESLDHGKFCLASDVDPLRETGRDLVEYIHPLDTFAWAERMQYWFEHPGQLAEKESRILAEWQSTTWRDSAVRFLELLYAAHAGTTRAPAPASAQAA